MKKGGTLKGLILADPWFAGSQNYAQEAKVRWGGEISWRTATSFDASKALIEALSGKNPTRATVLQNLRFIYLASTETSGKPVQFSAIGEMFRDPVLIKAVRRDFKLVQL